MPHTILKIGDLDLQGQIDLHTSEILKVLKTLILLNFYLPTVTVY